MQDNIEMMLYSLKVTLTEFPCSHVAIQKHVDTYMRRVNSYVHIYI